MTPAMLELLKQFDVLSDNERSQVVAELVRRVALVADDAPVDDDFIGAADRLLTDLDRRES